VEERSREGFFERGVGRRGVGAGTTGLLGETTERVVGFNHYTPETCRVMLIPKKRVMKTRNHSKSIDVRYQAESSMCGKRVGKAGFLGLHDDT